MKYYYFDIETNVKSEKPDPYKDEIITIQFQAIDSKLGKPTEPLSILKSWESNEKETILKFLRYTNFVDPWNFIPVGTNIVQYDLLLLSCRANNYGLKLSYEGILRSPFIDIKSVLIILNKGQFKNSSLHNFTRKEATGHLIKKYFEDKEFKKIETYIEEETSAFLDLYQWMLKSLPESYSKGYKI